MTQKCDHPWISLVQHYNGIIKLAISKRVGKVQGAPKFQAKNLFALTFFNFKQEN